MITSILANFKQAWHSQVELETSAAESEEATPKKKKRLSNSYSDESDIEGILIYILSGIRFFRIILFL